MDRFSLLLLEPSEIYFEDFKVVYHTKPEDKKPSVHNEIPGRLKVMVEINIDTFHFNMLIEIIGLLQEHCICATKYQFTNAQIPTH